MEKNDVRIPNDAGYRLNPFLDTPYYGQKTRSHDIGESRNVSLRH